MYMCYINDAVNLAGGGCSIGARQCTCHWSAGLVYFLSPALAPGGQLPDTLVVLSTVVLRLGGYTGWEGGGRERGMHLLKEVISLS